MSDLIRRADAIRMASGHCHPANIVKELEKLPPAQPQRTGRWVKIKESIKVSEYKCSKCGRTIWDDRGYDPYVDYPYCHCGARMEGEDNERA